MLKLSCQWATSALLASAVLPIQALTLDILPSAQAVTAGATTEVDIVVTGLEESGSDEVIGAYDLTLTFDPSALALTNSSANVAPFGANPEFSVDGSSAPGTVTLGLVSLVSDLELQGLQGNTVNLATLGFQTLGEGTSALDFSYVDIAGLNADALDVSVNGASITAMAPVPLPAMVWPLVGCALAAVKLGRRNSRASASVPACEPRTGSWTPEQPVF